MQKVHNQGPQKTPLPAFAALKSHLCLQERSRKLWRLVSFPLHVRNKCILNMPRSCLVETYLCNEQFLQSSLYIIQISKGQIQKIFSITWNGTAKKWWLYTLARHHIFANIFSSWKQCKMKIGGAVSSFNDYKFHIYVKKQRMIFI